MSDLSQQDIQTYFMTGHAGFWKIEYKDQQDPKLYADEQMDAVDVVDEDVLADKLRLTQILLNILGNCVKYNKIGGTLRLRLYQKHIPRIRLRIVKGRRFSWLKITASIKKLPRRY